MQVTGAGLDRLDRDALTRNGIPVANVAGGSNSALAEYAVTTASVLLRRLAWADGELKADNYAAFRARMVADNLAGIDGLTVGLVGFGTVGVAVAEAFHRMGCRIAYFDPAATPAAVAAATALGATAMTLNALLAAADVVSLHVPLLPQTTGLIGARQLALMKPGAVLIQASRGGVVDEAALAAHLAAGKIAGAAVDVYSTEPPTADNPLLALTGEGARRLLLTPHIAGVTRQSWTFLFRSSWRSSSACCCAARRRSTHLWKGGRGPVPGWEPNGTAANYLGGNLGLDQTWIGPRIMSLLKWALIFLVVSIIAGVFGFTGISAASADIARILFYIFVVIFLVLLVLGLTIFRV